MHSERMNHVSRSVMIALSGIALLTVLSGYAQAPQADEGTAAHIFQLSIVALLPAGIAFLISADWSRPRRSVRPLVLAGTLVVLAFANLYYLEHYFWKLSQ